MLSRDRRYARIVYLQARLWLFASIGSVFVALGVGAAMAMAGAALVCVGVANHWWFRDNNS